MRNVFDEIAHNIEQEAQNENVLTYKSYMKTLLQSAEDASKDVWMRKVDNLTTFRPDLYQDSEVSTIKISPELTKIWPLLKRERKQDDCKRIVTNYYDDSQNCLSINVQQLKETLKNLEERENNGRWSDMWYSTTDNGIEIHCGQPYATKRLQTIRLGDECVHGLLAGRTGSGKSVALHTIISSLLLKYAPWEININLADFKIVELSKYGNLVRVPHVSKIAATDSMEYVLSVMYDMYDKMNTRQKVFAALGIQKLADFRKEFNVVLPREILIVDEFQQMYELANPKQVGIINQLIKMITKLGRATGFHLLFASQNMSGTVPSDVKTNFKLRMCLAANSDVSTEILGNSAAADLKGLDSKGVLIANTEGGAEEYNVKIQVPYIKDKGKNEQEVSLEDVLKAVNYVAENLSYQKPFDFYKEDYIRRFDDGTKQCFFNDLEIFHQNAKKLTKDSKEIDMFLLLGDSCVYAKSEDKKSSLEYTPIRVGDKKNLLCLGDSIEQRLYLIKLLMSQYEQYDVAHFMTFGDVQLKDRIGNYIDDSKYKEISANKLSNDIINILFLRLCYMKYSSLPREFQNEEKFLSVIGEGLIKVSPTIHAALEDDDLMLKRMEEIHEKYGSDVLKIDADNTWEESTKNIYKQLIIKTSEAYYSKYRTYRDCNGKYRKRIVFWIVGFSELMDELNKICRAKKIEWLGKTLIDIIKEAGNMQVDFIFVGSRVSDLDKMLKDTTGYYFVASSDEKNYFSLDMSVPKNMGSDVIRFKAKNEVLNNQKAGLYILPQDEKIVKFFELEDIGEYDHEEHLFRGIEE